MSFSVSFSMDVPSGAVVSASESWEPDYDYDILVMVACAALADAGGGRFHLGGFGSADWPVDVSYDMSTFMEQFPLLLAGVRERHEVEVDLYAQGVERTLTFRPDGDLVVIRCCSRTDWVPDPECESIHRNELVAMLTKLAEDFAGGLKAIDSELSGITPFDRWLMGEV